MWQLSTPCRDAKKLPVGESSARKVDTAHRCQYFISLQEHCRVMNLWQSLGCTFQKHLLPQKKGGQNAPSFAYWSTMFADRERDASFKDKGEPDFLWLRNTSLPFCSSFRKQCESRTFLLEATTDIPVQQNGVKRHVSWQSVLRITTSKMLVIGDAPLFYVPQAPPVRYLHAFICRKSGLWYLAVQY